MIYLQGGPGKSGTFGQFLEIGPLGFNAEGILYRRKHTVQKIFNVLFLDQPAGSGFSFTKSSMGYARSIDDCVVAMREFLRQFLVLFPENKNRELYLAGESYGTRGAVALAYSLLTNPSPGLPLKVSGVIAGSPAFGNVLDEMAPADTLYHFGMLDSNGRELYAQAMQRIRQLWANNRTVALHLLSHTIFRLHPTPSLFSNLTGYNDHASLLSDQRPREFVHYYRYMQKPLFKRSLHLCSHATVDSSRLLVMLYLAGDYVADLREKVQYLLDSTKVLVFTGQLDTVFSAVNQEKYLMSLNWTGTAAFRKAARRAWYASGPGSKLQGYVKTTKGLTYVVLVRSGHHVLFDASEAVYHVIENFASGVDVINSRRNVLGSNTGKRPLLLWVQGGPGSSALYGQFLENGPLGIDADGRLYRRSHTLLNMFNIIYLDHPVGSGYSFDKNEDYPSTLGHAAMQGLTFLRRFLKIFDEYRRRDFFIAGESYGARSVIGLTQRLLTQRPKDLPLRLKGVMLGVGFVFPLLDIINSTDFLYFSGLLDERGRERKLCTTNSPASRHHASIVEPSGAKEVKRYLEYANSASFKKIIHVDSSRTLEGKSTQLVKALALGDFFVDKTSTLVDVLNSVRVLFYTAELDAVFPAVNIARSFDKLQWRGAALFKKASRNPWYYAGQPRTRRVLRGYERVAGTLMYYTVLFGGHHVSMDQSAAVSEMYGRFLRFVRMRAANIPA
ncbi:hypothetical protein HPB50_003608 [Hyalomma asiaticum]|uniref:Uncharacterized protein n=1 Tax=Hyalomma asiaticum TaxID=266040 RepID=A0ACB7RJZ2_HYAAI|nr:hypothetical protein HPB50_003608 [Hyalomma asiaticum]